MNFKIFYLVAVFSIILTMGVSSEITETNGTNSTNESVYNETANKTLNGNDTKDKKEITINNIEITIDDVGLVHLTETLIIPTHDNKGELLVLDDILIPEDAKNSLSLFYELGIRKLDFKREVINGKELVTIFFPKSAKPDENKVITISYTTYQFLSTSAGVGKLEFFEFPVTPDVTTITIKFPEGAGIIPISIPDSTSTISGDNKLKIRPKIKLFNLTYRYYLPMPSPIPSKNVSEDKEPPAIILKSPGSNVTLPEGNVSFKYSAEDKSGIKNCELIINSNAAKSDAEVTRTDNEFIINLDNGTYIWAIQCKDKSKNENSAIATSRTLTIISQQEPPDWKESILNIFKSEYSISLMLAIFLIVYLIFAYIKRREKSKLKRKEPELEELYPAEEKEKKETIEKEKTNEINPSIIKLLDENEKKILNILKDYEETTQANIYKITQIPKATLSNIMKKLEDRNLIERRAEGKVKWVKLKDWVFE